MSTPDTEWEKWVRTLANSGNHHDVDLLIAKIKVLLSSHDTYWKEQLQKAEQRGEERMKRAQEQTNEYYKLRCEKELQKARIDFLRSEIEKLEGIEYESEDSLISPLESHRLYDIEYGFRMARASIITRHKEELKVLESK